MLGISDIVAEFSGKRVLITGHTGFKGSWLAFLLHHAGADVLGFALDPITPVNNFDLLGLEKKIHHVVGDIRDLVKLSSAVNDFQPQYVFHLAAQSLVRPSYAKPENTFSTNVMGTVNLLEAVRHCNSVRSLVFITSDKCYENMEWIWGYRESDKLGGIDPYSSSKACAEIIFSSYARSFFNQNSAIGIATARAGNVIGGGDWAIDRIIPDCIRAINADEPIRVRNPLATRPWQHVLEPLGGYIQLAIQLNKEPKKWGGAWNFGPSTEDVRTVKELADGIVKHFGRGMILIESPQGGVHEAFLLQLNCDKANQLMGWRPRWHFEETIKATAIWYKNVADGDDAESITRSQINEYFGGLE